MESWAPAVQPPHQGHQQEAVADQAVGAARPRQLGLEREDRGEHDEQHGENRDVHPRIAPGLDPGLDLRCDSGRLRHQDERGRQLVFDRDDRGGELSGGVDHQLERPRLHGVEAGTGRHGEQSGGVLRLESFGGAHQERLVVLVDEADGAAVLDDPHAIEAIAVDLPEMAGAVKVMGSVRGHEDDVCAAGDAAAQVLVSAHAEYIAADLGRRQQPKENLGVEVAGLAQRHFQHRVGRAGLGQQCRDLARGHATARHRALSDEVVPRFQRETVDVEGGHRDGPISDPGRQHQPRGVVDAGPHQARRDGRPGDEVRPQHRQPAGQRYPGLARPGLCGGR